MTRSNSEFKTNTVGVRLTEPPPKTFLHPCLSVSIRGKNYFAAVASIGYAGWWCPFTDLRRSRRRQLVSTS